MVGSLRNEASHNYACKLHTRVCQSRTWSQAVHPSNPLPFCPRILLVRAIYTAPTFSFYHVRVKDITRVLQHIPRLKNKNSCTIKIFSLCRIIGIMHERIIIEIIFGTSIFRENGLVGKFIIKSYYLSYNIIR